MDKLKRKFMRIRRGLRQFVRSILHFTGIRAYLDCHDCGRWYNPLTEYKEHRQRMPGEAWRNSPRIR